MKKYRNITFALTALSLMLYCQSNNIDTVSTEQEPENNVVTLWTEKTEVFMEYPPIKVGDEVEFIVHLTVLENFKPVLEGKLTTEFKHSSGQVISIERGAPDFPGIYRPAARFNTAGAYVMNLIVESPQIQDRIIVGIVKVSDGSLEEEHAHTASGKEFIQFLKEQQWRIGFRTELVSGHVLQNSIEATGIIQYEPNRYVEIPAPVNGILYSETNNNLPKIGTRISKNAILAVLSPPVDSKNGLVSLKTDYLLAKAEFERSERLYAGEAISEKRLIEAQMDYKAKKAALTAFYGLSGDNWDNNEDFTSILRSPISGYIETIDFKLGKSVKSGDRLFTVIDPGKILLKVNVPAARISQLSSASNASFVVEGFEEEFIVSNLNGKLISIGNSVDQLSRTVPVIFSLDNPENILKIGMFASVSLKIEEPFFGLSLPKSAVFDDNGTAIAYIHTEGEMFEKRILKTGVSDRGFIHILSGVSEGERVVITGGYQIKLASLSSVVPEGHGHSH